MADLGPELFRKSQIYFLHFTSGAVFRGKVTSMPAFLFGPVSLQRQQQRSFLLDSKQPMEDPIFLSDSDDRDRDGKRLPIDNTAIAAPGAVYSSYAFLDTAVALQCIQRNKPKKTKTKRKTVVIYTCRDADCSFYVRAKSDDSGRWTVQQGRDRAFCLDHTCQDVPLKARQRSTAVSRMNRAIALAGVADAKARVDTTIAAKILKDAFGNSPSKQQVCASGVGGGRGRKVAMCATGPPRQEPRGRVEDWQRRQLFPHLA